MYVCVGATIIIKKISKTTKQSKSEGKKEIFRLYLFPIYSIYIYIIYNISVPVLDNLAPEWQAQVQTILPLLQKKFALDIYNHCLLIIINRFMNNNNNDKYKYKYKYRDRYRKQIYIKSHKFIIFDEIRQLRKKDSKEGIKSRKGKKLLPFISTHTSTIITKSTK